MKKMGRPEIDLNRKKDQIIRCRIDNELDNQLNYIKMRTGKNTSEIIRIGIEMYFNELIKN